MFNKEEFNKKINILFDNKNQKELAELLGISQTMVSALKKGKVQSPGADILFNIAKHFNVSADYLLGLSDVPSVDTDLKAVCDYTGLSQEALEFITHTYSPLVKQSIDVFLSNNYTTRFFMYFTGIIKAMSLIDQLRAEDKGKIDKISKQIDEAFEFGNEKNIPDDYFDYTNEYVKAEYDINAKIDLELFRMSKILSIMVDKMKAEKEGEDENT